MRSFRPDFKAIWRIESHTSFEIHEIKIIIYIFLPAFRGKAPNMIAQSASLNAALVELGMVPISWQLYAINILQWRIFTM